MRALPLTLAAAAGLVVGVSVTYLREPAAPVRAEEVSPALPVEPDARLEESAHDLAATERHPTPADAGPSRSAVLPLFSPALLEHAKTGIKDGWRAERRDSIPTEALSGALAEFEESVLALPEAIGRRLAREQTKHEEALEDARTGGVFALIEKLDAGGAGPVLELVSDDGAFDGFFARDAAESFVDGVTQLGSGERPPDGTTLTFPAGVFRLSDFTREWSNRAPFPRDVTITGAGMNSTLLVGADFSAYSKLRNLTIRDCTLYADRGYLFDLRREPAVVTVERVRLCGFDSGAGSSCAFTAPGLALRVRDSIVTEGYGRHPGSGRLFRMNTDALVARFERCTIQGTRVASGLRDGATVVFSACSFRDIREDLSAAMERLPGLMLVGCSVQPYEGESSGFQQTLRRNMNDLFPNWQDQL